MKPDRAKQIVNCYTRLEDAEPDISTERLLEMVSQECGCDNADVCDALEKIEEQP